MVVKTNIASIYWILLWGTFTGLLVILPAMYMAAKFLGIPFMEIYSSDFSVTRESLVAYPIVVAFLLSSIFMHLLLIRRNKIVWYIAVTLYVLQAIFSIPLLFQPGIWFFPSFEGPLFWSLFTNLAMIGVFMTYFTLFSLIADRKLFFKPAIKEFSKSK
ncbi:MAG: hypothetical protein QG639_585 [Patescibacteria group bacterium]|jgi:hypothetical protein|nr:hypothetical protein [Patescibacteria group bacterium]